VKENDGTNCNQLQEILHRIRIFKQLNKNDLFMLKLW